MENISTREKIIHGNRAFLEIRQSRVHGIGYVFVAWLHNVYLRPGVCQDIKEKGRRIEFRRTKASFTREIEPYRKAFRGGTFSNRCLLDAGGHKEPWLFLASNVGSSTRSLSLPRGWDGRRVELITVRRFARMAFVFGKRSNSRRLFVWEIVEKTVWVWEKYLRERRGSTPMERRMVKVVMRSEWNERRKGKERIFGRNLNYFVILMIYQEKFYFYTFY